MKYILILLLSLTTAVGTAQVSGKIALDGRKVIQEISYSMEMKATGVLVFDIAVDVKGNVTSCIRNKIESTVKNTVYSYQAKNLILMKLKFEKGNGYPTFHQGKVTISGRLAE